MERKTLTSLEIKNAMPATHVDGTQKQTLLSTSVPNLYVQITPSKDPKNPYRSWAFIYKCNGKRTSIGLGSVSDVGMLEAKEKAIQYNALRALGTDPLAEKRRREAALIADAESARVQAVVEEKAAITFDQCAKQCFDAKKHEWDSEIHAYQWQKSLEQYASPILGKMSVSQIDSSHVLQVLKQNVDGKEFWHKYTETANRVRSRIARVLGFAMASGYRPKGPNPGAWSDNLQDLLATPSRIKKTRHFPTFVEKGEKRIMEKLRDIQPFMVQLRADERIAARAVELCILTATRCKETRLARWKEIDWDSATWTIPESRMKGKKNEREEHHVPLSAQALGLLKSLKADDAEDNDYIFANQKMRPPLEMCMLNIVYETSGALWGFVETPPKKGVVPHNPRQRRKPVRVLTVHGMRSAFRTWCAETGVPEKVAEAAIAHVEGKTKRSYQHSDRLELRRPVMASWANFIDGKAPAPVNKEPIDDSNVLLFPKVA
jgi:integrase